MAKPFSSNLFTLASMGLVSAVILTGIAPNAQSSSLKEQTLVAINFKAPSNDQVPTTVGGGTRGSISFRSANDQGSSTNVSGGVRGNIQFQSANDQGSSTNVSGGVRGNINFQSANDQGSSTNVSGGVRGDVNFQSANDQGTSNVSSGGVRGDVNFQSANDQSSTHTVSGGTRTESMLELTALLPENKYGRTVSARPTFFVYLPPSNSQQVFFSIQDEQKNHHYQTILNVSGQGGVVSFTLPQDAPELALNTNYIWYFAPIEANGILRPDNYAVSGWIKRVDQVAINHNDNIIQQAADYAESGVWYDTLALLASAQKQEPNNQVLASEWHDLLQQVGLTNMAQQPILQAL